MNRVTVFYLYQYFKKSILCWNVLPTNYLWTSGAVKYLLSKDTLFFALVDSPLIGVNPCDIHEGKLKSSPAHILLSCYTCTWINRRLRYHLLLSTIKLITWQGSTTVGKAITDTGRFDVYIKLRVLVSVEKKEYYPCILFYNKAFFDEDKLFEGVESGHVSCKQNLTEE